MLRIREHGAELGIESFPCEDGSGSPVDGLLGRGYSHQNSFNNSWKCFVTGVAPSLQNWWTFERSSVGSTPIHFRQKESQKAPQSLKSLAGLYFIQVSYSPIVSLGIWTYQRFVGIFVGTIPAVIIPRGEYQHGPIRYQYTFYKTL